MAPKVAELGFLNSGQICLALKRIFIHEDIYDEFRDAMIEHTKKLQMGDGFTDGVFLGPIQNSMQYEKVSSLFADIEKSGQKVAVGGKVENSDGYYITPTIIDNPKEDSRIVQEEPFGPILPILKWSTEEEVIERANATDMGLGASIWTTSLEEAERIGRQLEAGSVWTNGHLVGGVFLNAKT
jgi:acyl-CoA reductase-like NAD-dependent aldehyde dehydrogenase